MKNKNNLILIFLGLTLVFLLLLLAFKPGKERSVDPVLVAEEKVKGIMILIEYKDMLGLSNFVNELSKRNIFSLLMLTPEFVQDNCEEIKEIIKHDVEIVASNIGAPLWDMPYEEQKERIIEMKEGIEACTGVPIRIISSTYMASDAETIKVAHELGIPFVTARGTSDTKASVYQVEDYPGVKIFSISNIPMAKYKYGSLCDYSYFERNGGPEDMLAELDRSLEPLSSKEMARLGVHHKISPVSHTNIGGYLEPWTNMWTKFWDENKDKIDWVDLDEFMAESDWVLPLWQIPVNKNNPYTPEKIRPAVSYDEIEKVHNPCLVENIGKDESLWESVGGSDLNHEKYSIGEKIIVFHNNSGPMCLDFLEFIKTIDYPIEEHLDSDSDFSVEFDKLRQEFSSTEGIHPLYGYYPIIFIKDRVFSGFNEAVKTEILKEINK